MNQRPRQQFQNMAHAMQTLEAGRRRPEPHKVRDWVMANRVKMAKRGQQLTAVRVRPPFHRDYETMYVDAQAYSAFLRGEES